MLPVFCEGEVEQKFEEKVIDMEIEANDHQDVAEPDHIASGTAGTGQERTTNKKNRGDLAFYLYDRQERISDRLNKKIGRLERRITALEERGRS
jgi:hypothetical protein